MNQDSLIQFVRSRWFVGAIASIGVLLIAACIFEAGIFVGFREAQFSARWGQNYAANFGGAGFGSNGIVMLDAHGAFGKIVDISTATSTLTIMNAHQQEQKVLLQGDTVIRDRDGTITTTQLAVGMYVVVVGEPNGTGEIDAKLVRVVPTPITKFMSTTASSSTLK